MLKHATQIAALTCAAALLHACDKRAPESALYGTWHDTRQDTELDSYYQFKPDHTFTILAPSMGEITAFAQGRWYAGGQKIYLRYEEDIQGDRRPVIWHIVDVSRDELAVRVLRDGEIIHYRRVKLDAPKASNKALERTAIRFAFTACVAKTRSLWAAPAAGGRRSSWSR
jgi:hypothetical protein